MKGGRSQWAYLIAVPTSNCGAAADIGEVHDIPLCLPAVSRNQAIGAVGAAHDGEGAGDIIVIHVVGD